MQLTLALFANNVCRFLSPLSWFLSHILLLFATRYNPKIRRELAHEIIGRVPDQLKEYFFTDYYIRENVHLNEAQTQGKDIFEYKLESIGAKDYV